jgi:hypothetical protein
MNNYQLQELLRGYPVTICAADQIKMQKDGFVISNTDTSDGPGKHWVVFHFSSHGPDYFFDSLGRRPSDYNVNFDRFLKNPYWLICNQLQSSNSTVCGHYCVYFVKTRQADMSMQDIVKPFNVNDKNFNDHYVVTFVNKNKQC